MKTRIALHLCRCAALIVPLLLLGCAAVPRTDFDKSGYQNIKTVTLLVINESQHITARNFTSEGLGVAVGGLLGGAMAKSVDTTVPANPSEAFLKAINDRKLQFAPPMVAALQKELGAKGIRVNYSPHQKPKLAADGGDDYSEIQTDADAILNVWFGVTGYAVASFSGYYQPWLRVNVRLLDPHTKRILYFRAFNFGLPLKMHNVEDIAADEKYRYASFDTLMNKFDEAAEAIVIGEQQIAARIANDLK